MPDAPVAQVLQDALALSEFLLWKPECFGLREGLMSHGICRYTSWPLEWSGARATPSRVGSSRQTLANSPPALLLLIALQNDDELECGYLSRADVEWAAR